MDQIGRHGHFFGFRRATAASAVSVALLAGTSLTWAAAGPRRAAAAGATGQVPPLIYGAPRTVLSGPSAPEGVAVDGAGDVFMTYAASGQVVEVPKVGKQIVLPFSSLAAPALVGQGGPLDGVAVDRAGDVFVADTGHNQVLELPKGGSQIVLPITGLDFPGGIAVDGAGNVFVGDSYHSRVLELPKGGYQTIVPFTGIGQPGGLALDAAGDLFLADSSNSRILKLPKGGTQVALPVTSSPTGVAVDGAGNVFVTAFHLGATELTAGGGQTQLPLSVFDPRGIAVDTAGDVFVTDPALNRVLELPSGGTVTSFPPNSSSYPTGLAVDNAGDVFVSDYFRNTVVELPAGGGAPITLPFIGLSAPEGLAVDQAGDVLVVDAGNLRVLELPMGGTQVTVPFHGLTHPGGIAVDAADDVFVTDGAGVVALPRGGSQVSLPLTGLHSAVGVAVDGDGNVFVSDAGVYLDGPCFTGCQVVELHRSGGQTTVAGNSSQFPGVAVDHAGDLFVAAGGVSELPRGATAVQSVPVSVVNPSGVAVDHAGDVFVTDPILNSVQEVPIDQALFVNPVNGQPHVDTTQPFTWSTIPAAQGYYLTVGTTVYGKDLVDSGILAPSQSSLAVPVLPSGLILYGTLYTEENGTWTRAQPIAFTALDRMAAFTYPVDGQANVDTTKPFTWTQDSASQGYILVVGTAKFGHDLVNSGFLSPGQKSFAVPSLPGGILYATLLTKVNGSYSRYRSASFTAASGGAVFTHPVAAQQNVDTTAPFTWSTVAHAQGYDLIVGTTVYGHDLVNSGVLAATTSSFAGPALPTGTTLYATVYTEINGGWVNYNLVGFTAAARPARTG